MVICFRFGMVKLQHVSGDFPKRCAGVFPLWHGKVATFHFGWRRLGSFLSGFRFGMVKLQPSAGDTTELPTDAEFPLWHGKVATHVLLPS